jgi:hypothetical protein
VSGVQVPPSLSLFSFGFLSLGFLYDSFAPHPNSRMVFLLIFWGFNSRM